MKPSEDVQYWQNLSPPLCPNEYEVEIYKHHAFQGPICLLGMTKNLQKICDFMVDLNPIPQKKPVIKCDWNDMDVYAETLIGDGVVNLEGLGLIDKLLNKYNKIICRVFLNKFPWMKYATYFPQKFPGSSLIIPTQENISIVVWDRS